MNKSSYDEAAEVVDDESVASETSESTSPTKKRGRYSEEDKEVSDIRAGPEDLPDRPRADTPTPHAHSNLDNIPTSSLFDHSFDVEMDDNQVDLLVTDANPSGMNQPSGHNPEGACAASPEDLDLARRFQEFVISQQNNFIRVQEQLIGHAQGTIPVDPDADQSENSISKEEIQFILQNEPYRQSFMEWKNGMEEWKRQRSIFSKSYENAEEVRGEINDQPAKGEVVQEEMAPMEGIFDGKHQFPKLETSPRISRKNRKKVLRVARQASNVGIQNSMTSQKVQPLLDISFDTTERKAFLTTPKKMENKIEELLGEKGKEKSKEISTVKEDTLLTAGASARPVVISSVKKESSKEDYKKPKGKVGPPKCVDTDVPKAELPSFQGYLYACKQCNYAPSGLNKFATHGIQMHDTSAKCPACPSCRHLTPEKQRIHFFTIHPDVAKYNFGLNVNSESDIFIKTFNTSSFAVVKIGEESDPLFIDFDDEGAILCHYCEKYAGSYHQLAIHMKLSHHENLYRYRCPRGCQLSASTRVNLARANSHIIECFPKSTHRELRLQYSCKCCIPNTMKSKRPIWLSGNFQAPIEHLINVHGYRRLLFRCPICPFVSIGGNDALKFHLNTYHGDVFALLENGRFPTCFRKMDNYLELVSVSSPWGSKSWNAVGRFLCNECGDKQQFEDKEVEFYLTDGAVFAHCKKVHEMKETLMQCLVCDIQKTFSNMKSLHDHTLEHIVERRDNRISFSVSLKCQLRNKESNLNCDFSVINSLEKMVNHIEAEHGLTVENGDYFFRCKFCRWLRCVDLTSLTRHLRRSHLFENPYEQFIAAGTNIRFLEFSGKEEPFICNLNEETIHPEEDTTTISSESIESNVTLRNDQTDPKQDRDTTAVTSGKGTKEAEHVSNSLLRVETKSKLKKQSPKKKLKKTPIKSPAKVAKDQQIPPKIEVTTTSSAVTGKNDEIVCSTPVAQQPVSNDNVNSVSQTVKTVKLEELKKDDFVSESVNDEKVSATNLVIKAEVNSNNNSKMATEYKAGCKSQNEDSSKPTPVVILNDGKNQEESCKMENLSQDTELRKEKDPSGELPSQDAGDTKLQMAIENDHDSCVDSGCPQSEQVSPTIEHPKLESREDAKQSSEATESTTNPPDALSHSNRSPTRRVPPSQPDGKPESLIDAGNKKHSQGKFVEKLLNDNLLEKEKEKTNEIQTTQSPTQKTNENEIMNASVQTEQEEAILEEESQVSNQQEQINDLKEQMIKHQQEIIQLQERLKQYNQQFAELRCLMEKLQLQQLGIQQSEQEEAQETVDSVPVDTIDPDGNQEINDCNAEQGQEVCVTTSTPQNVDVTSNAGYMNCNFSAPATGTQPTYVYQMPQSPYQLRQMYPQQMIPPAFYQLRPETHQRQYWPQSTFNPLWIPEQQQQQTGGSHSEEPSNQQPPYVPDQQPRYHWEQQYRRYDDDASFRQRRGGRNQRR